MNVAVVGGGIAGLAAARALEELVEDAEIVLVESDERLGGKLLTERHGDFLVEGAADSFLSRKPRGIGLVRELGLEGEVIGRRPENARTFVRRGRALHPLPEGLTGMVPTDLAALDGSPLLSREGRLRLERERELPPAAADADESIAAFVRRRLGREAYDSIVEPLVTGIYGGDGELLSLGATFPQLRALEVEHGSLLRGLEAQQSPASGHPPFVSLRDGIERLADAIGGSLERTAVETGRTVVALRVHRAGYELEVADGTRLDADGVVVATPAFAAAELFATFDAALAELHTEVPYASPVVVTLGFTAADLGRELDAYGYVVPKADGADVLACTWTSAKWAGRAPDGLALVRVYAGRFGGRDLTAEDDGSLLELARSELALADIDADPVFTRIHRWPRGMPQYVLGHPERLRRIDAALDRHRGLALAGAAYRGVGIPDCIASGEDAARSVAAALVRTQR